MNYCSHTVEQLTLVAEVITQVVSDHKILIGGQGFLQICSMRMQVLLQLADPGGTATWICQAERSWNSGTSRVTESKGAVEFRADTCWFSLLWIAHVG